MEHRQKFDVAIKLLHNAKAKNSQIVTKSELDGLVEKLKELRRVGPNSKNKNDYYLIKKYELQLADENYSVIKKGSGKIIVSTNDLYDAVKTAHQSTGHGGRTVTLKELNEKFANISQEIVSLFIEGCDSCQMKRNKTRKGLVVRPITSHTFNSRCQVDLIDLQTRPDGCYEFIFVYQDHLTKFVRLRPLKTKTAKEVAYNLIDVFTDLGSPCILQSDNGREFANQVSTNS